jgi:hypothetical protein
VATPSPATLEEFLAYLNKDSNAVDTVELQDTLEGATEAAEGWHNVGPIMARSFTDRVEATADGKLILPHTPVQSVTSATRIQDSFAYLTVDLDVDKKAGIVSGLNYRLPPGDYDVICEAGRNPVPVSLKQAVLIIAGHHWQTQQNTPTRNRFAGSENDGVRVSMGYLIPNRAAHLLQPHASMPVA